MEIEQAEQPKPWHRVVSAGSKRAQIVIDGDFDSWDVNSAQFRSDVNALGDIKELKVTITSRGGDVFEGLAMAEFVSGLPYRTVASIEGLAASMGMYFAAAFDHVTASKGSLIMIHNARMVAAGDANTMEAAARDLRSVGTPLFNYLKDRPNMSLSDEELQAALDAETFYTAEEAQSIGLIDAVLQRKADLTAVASMDWTDKQLEKIPKDFLARVNAQLEPTTTGDGFRTSTTTDDENMSTQKTDAESAAEIAQAVATNNERWGKMLAHKNGSNVEAVTKINAMGLSVEQSLEMLDMVAPAEQPEAKVEAKEEAVAKPEEESELMKVFKAIMTNNELSNVNKQSGQDDDIEPVAKAEDPKAILANLKGKNGELV